MIPRPYVRALAVFALGYIGLYSLYVAKVFVSNHPTDSKSVPRRQLSDRLYSSSTADTKADRSSLTSVTATTNTSTAIKMVEQLLEHAGRENVHVPDWLRTLPHRRPLADSLYYLSAVVRVRLYKEDKSKWTIVEFKQWMHYQFWAGAEHIYICNHFLTESESLINPLEQYVKLGLVTVFPWNHIRAVRGSSTYVKDNANNQDSCYQHVLDKYRNQSVWQYNFDMDENPYCPRDQSEGFLAKFLKELSQSESGQPPSERTVDIRVQNFILHGQGDRKRNMTYDRINRITPHIANQNWKAIYQPKFVDGLGMHGVKERRGKMWVAEPTKLKMLHYWGARAQEWGPDTPALYKYTVEFNDIRNSIAISVRNSLLALNETEAFSCDTGP